jgi:YVTN family beta-propeller protein
MTYVLKASVPVQSNPIPVLYSNGSIWVGNNGSGSISRIDPLTNTVTATITAVGIFVGISALAEDDLGNVWVASADFTDGSVSRIDPATNTVTASLYTTNGLRPIGIGMGAGEMWVSLLSSSGRYRRFNTTTLAETYASGTGLSYGYNFVDDGTNVWFYGAALTVIHKIDPATNTVTTLTTGITSGFGFLHYAFGYVWSVTGSGLQRIDPTTNALTTITLSISSVDGVTDDGTNIIAADIAGEIYVIDPTSLTVKQTITTVNRWWGITFDGSSIWANAYGPSGTCKKFSPLPVGWVRGHAWG